MSAIRGKNTKPELVVRKLLHGCGFRFRLHRKDLPGKPDLVLPKYRKAVFVNGCYWHGHEDCELFRLPKSRKEFWSKKITGNRLRDDRNRDALIEAGWKVVTVWECAACKSNRLPTRELADALKAAILSNAEHTVIRSVM